MWSSGGFGAVHRHFVCELYFTDKMSVNACDQKCCRNLAAARAGVGGGVISDSKPGIRQGAASVSRQISVWIDHPDRGYARVIPPVV